MRRPDAPAALTDMGDALRAAGDAENAMTCYLRALQVAPESFVARHGLGLLMLRSGRPEEAATWFAAAIEADPAQGIAQFNLAEARRQLGDAPGAMAHVERALALGFEAAEAHFLHGCLLSRSGRLDPSVAAFGKACPLFTIYAAQAGDLPKRETEVNLSRLLELVGENHIGNRVTYWVREKRETPRGPEEGEET